MAKSGSKQVHQQANIDNRGALFNNVGTVINGNVSTKVVHEKAVTYAVDKKDVKGLEAWSRFVMKVLGEQRTKLYMVVSGGLGGIGLVGGTSAADTLGTMATPALYAGLSFAGIATSLFSALQYRNSSRCHKCNTFYAMREVGTPTRREVPARGGTRQTTTRHYECKQCGATDSTTSNDVVSDDE